MRNGMGRVRVGIDIGGTFTDFALETGTQRITAKLLTTLDNPVDACMRGLAQVIRQAGLEPGDVDAIVHGTTLATNALIERKGAVTAMITTQGFRDVIEIGTEGRPEQYDINILKPAPLVPRRRRFVVEERMNRDGAVLLPLHESDLAALLPALDAAGTQSLAIAFLHSYVNPAHERAARDFFGQHRPDWFISLSSDISPEFREFERFSTTCANAYIQPLVSRYLAEFQQRLAATGYHCGMLMMLSSGGLTTVDTARDFPIRLVESGPAGGAIFACDVARRLGIDRAVSFDMGGTTAKICLLDRALAQTSRRFEVARVYRFRKDSGLPLRIPVIDMVEIGAGGGSITHVDELGRLSVGPESAGSDPGPACYGLGGDRPTVTDANVVLGRIDPAGFAGGRMPLDAAAAAAALHHAVGIPLSLGATAAAFGVTEMVCENMASAARVHAIESGKNADGRTLIAFGGAAPLHVCQMADKLGVDRIIVPSNAGVGSAVGFLRAPVSYEVVRTLYHPLVAFDADLCNHVLAEMEAEARIHVGRGAAPDAPLGVRRQAFMRYSGQGHEIAVALPTDRLASDAGTGIQHALDHEYERVFGRNISAIARGEIVSLSVQVATAAHPDPVPALQSAPVKGAVTHRRAFDSVSQSDQDFTILARTGLGATDVIAGPAILTEDETSIVVSSSFEARILPGGDIELCRKTAPTLAAATGV
jgi:N-methylhydantoinase A